MRLLPFECMQMALDEFYDFVIGFPSIIELTDFPSDHIQQHNRCSPYLGNVSGVLRITSD